MIDDLLETDIPDNIVTSFFFIRSPEGDGREEVELGNSTLVSRGGYNTSINVEIVNMDEL